MMLGPREEVYDDQIAPLMTEIIRICQEAGIPLLASFELDMDEENGPLFCTTSILPSGTDPRLTAAHKAIMGQPMLMALTIPRGKRLGLGDIEELPLRQHS
jgi:hypothetical protein